MIGLLLIGLFALIFVSAALAPMESFGWWAGWGAKPPKKNELAEARSGRQHCEPEADFYLVYLSGIGAISGTSVPAEEYPFIYGLRKRLPKAEIISDIYPYSVTNNGLDRPARPSPGSGAAWRRSARHPAASWRS